MDSDMITFMQQFVKNVKSDESLSGFLKNKSEETLPGLGHPKDYFFLTGLCDPMSEFVKRKLPSVELTMEAKKRIARGNKLHSFAKNWFQRMDGCEASESNLDGVHFGLPVVGRIDAKINGSIIELKTKANIPMNAEEIFQRCPGDIEQLGFYSVLDPTKPVKNYLVYMSHGSPAEVRAFKVIVKDHNRIKGVLKKRIDDIQDALKKKDPSALGHCRYCWEGCQLKKEDICKWSEIPRKECEISEFIEISEDISFAEKFEKSLNTWNGSDQTIPIFGLILPLKYFHKNILGKDDPFEKSSDETKNEDHIKDLVFNFKKRYNPEKGSIPVQSFTEISFSRHNWIKYISTSRPQGEVLPFISCTNEYNYEGILTSPPKYRLAELGIIASTFGKSSGLIFIYYPNVDKGQYRVFKIDYSFSEKSKIRIRKIIDIIKSEDEKSMKNLPACPWFLSKDNCIGCNFRKDCAQSFEC